MKKNLSALLIIDTLVGLFGFGLYSINSNRNLSNAEVLKLNPTELKNAAEQGNAFAQLKLGNAYYSGEGVAKDTAEAVKWYRKAAEQGDAVAQNNLGWAYYSGDGVAKDLSEGVKWWTKSAEQGDADAQLKLGWAYYNGVGVAKDSAEGCPQERAYNLT